MGTGAEPTDPRCFGFWLGEKVDASLGMIWAAKVGPFLVADLGRLPGRPAIPTDVRYETWRRGDAIGGTSNKPFTKWDPTTVLAVWSQNRMLGGPDDDITCYARTDPSLQIAGREWRLEAHFSNAGQPVSFVRLMFAEPFPCREKYTILTDLVAHVAQRAIRVAPCNCGTACVRVLTRLGRAQELAPAVRFADDTRRAKRRRLGILNTNGAEGRAPLYRDLLKVTIKTINAARQAAVW